MNFASSEFWITLLACVPVGLLVVWLAGFFGSESRGLAGKWCMVGTALTLLYQESQLTPLVFLWVVLIGWGAVQCAVKGRSASFVILALLQLVPLIYYKYWNFFFNEALGLGWRVPSVLIPMGLSFYTFQVLGFCIDTRREQLKAPKFIDYLNFCSFFPQIVAGPIERRQALLPQIEGFRFGIRASALDPALRWIVLGLFYKVVLADNLGVTMSRLMVDDHNPWHVWLECFSFGMRIYFDFAGYSFIAVGLAMLFGIQLTLNFRSPYLSVDLREFWRNWHITLSSWLRDYVYLPLGGRRTRLWMVNVLIVFVVSGIWHGAGWGFLVWGALHGLGVVFCGWGKRWELPAFLKWSVTLVFAMGAWLFFLEPDPSRMWSKAASMVDPRGYVPGNARQLMELFRSPPDLVTFAAVCALGIGVLFLEWLSVRNEKGPYNLLRSTPACLMGVALVILLGAREEASFIYFNF